MKRRYLYRITNILTFVVIALSLGFISCTATPNNNKATNLVSVNTIKPRSKNQSDSKRGQVTFVDLASAKSSIIKSYKTIEHKTFSKKGEKDSLTITPQINSVLTADYLIKAKNDEEGDVILSHFKLLDRNRICFERDSVLAITGFELNKGNTFLSFSIIDNQNADTFNTTADLFLMDLSAKKIICLKKQLTNTANSPFSDNGKFVYYLNNSVLFRYDLEKKTTLKVLQFSTAVILQITVLSPTTFRVIYLKDISDGVEYATTIKIPAA